jgi:hypothetical protein
MSEALKGVLVLLAGLVAFLGALCYFMAGEPRAEPAATLLAPSTSTPPSSAPESKAVPAADVWMAINTAPKVNPRLTRAHFDQIQDGMTEERLTRLLGEVTEVKIQTKPDPNDDDLVKVLRWAQRESHETIEVELVNGRSQGKSTTLAAAAVVGKLPILLAEPPGMSRRNFEKIANGMTENQVTAILGPFGGSTTREGTWNGNPFHRRTLLWKQSSPQQDLTITVTFSDHKVSGKNWIQLTPIKK